MWGLGCFWTFCIALCLQHLPAHGGVTILLEKGTVNNTSKLPGNHQELNVVDNSNSGRVAVSSYKDSRNIGEPVIRLPGTKEWLQKQIDDLQQGSQLAGENDVFSSDLMQPKATTAFETVNRQQGSSHRTMRTFWPFTELFGYNYGPPPPPIFGYGPVVPLQPGFGMLPPPPPLLGLGYGMY